MQRTGITVLLIGGLLACRSSQGADKAPAPAQVEWSYAGSTGPEAWGDLSPDYRLAKTGKHQSPVDIASSRVKKMDAAPLEISYQDATLELLNNGHTVEDDYHDGGTLALDGRVYRLAQFHFHTPSEHTLDGRHAPMELHLVHKDAGGKLAVVGVLIQEGRVHPELELMTKHVPASPGRAQRIEGVTVNASRLLPGSLASYRYSGSLTTPPCTEDVAWFVLHEPIEASAEQIAVFRRVLHGNNRPTQPLNDRVITASR